MKISRGVTRSLVAGLVRPSVGYGGLSGGLLTAPLIAVMYLIDQVAGVPFVPFALFDWITRVLPGPVVTWGIDLMIDALRLVGLNVADAAKTAEQIGAVLLFGFVGVVVGSFSFAVMEGRKADPGPAWGLKIGAVVGIPMIAISFFAGQATGHPAIVGIGLSVLFLAWGMSFVPAYRKLLINNLPSPTIEPEIRSAQRINRRQFLIRLGATTATITVLGGSLGAMLASVERRRVADAIARSMETSEMGNGLPFPNANDPLVPAPGTRLEYTPVKDHYKVFIRAEPTMIDGDNWVLPITGLVDNPLVLTLADIQHNYASRDQYVTLSCISGRIATSLISTTWWTGVSLQQVLADAQPQAEARYLIITSGDGFYETVDLDLIASDERIMLCYAWDGRPIPFDHGFPLRVWLPDRYGMKQPKWITGMEVTNEYRPGYWVERGWDEIAQVKATSVIDTVAVNDIVESSDGRLVPVGGIAFSGARGISKVEVSVDDGPWQAARLRAPLSETTWVIWRYDWPFAEGNHTFEVRCAEADGTAQIEEEEGNHPNGATGIHRRKVDA
ncbi:MAG TPA: molybdopterin-dependent oxidoreductase [Dehalococcoidia bacterium]|nr:molybdopterin-dependent oxidoreductase [Dehalococcoidia bacterium]